MGQHKHNPTAIAAKEGKLPTKPKKMSTKELEREMRGMLWAGLAKNSPKAAAALAALSMNGYGGQNNG